MSRVLIDSNVILDVLTRDATWSDWSLAQIEQAAEAGLVINPVIYAELSAPYSSQEALDAALPTDFIRESLPWRAGFLAGKAFVDYRRRGGERRSPLPDFFIGAHAAVQGYVVLTRDPRRYRNYFPTVELITPAGL